MATNIQGNMKYKGRLSLLPSANAPLPEGANLFADFAGGDMSFSMSAEMLSVHHS